MKHIRDIADYRMAYAGAPPSPSVALSAQQEAEQLRKATVGVERGFTALNGTAVDAALSMQRFYAALAEAGLPLPRAADPAQRARRRTSRYIAKGGVRK